MKTKMLVLATAMMFASLANECQAQSNPCGAASFTFYGNFQNQQVRLYFIGVDGNLYNTLANNLAGNYADPQAAYLYNVVANNSPIASVIEQIVVNSNGIPQDGPNTFVFPSSPQYQQILDSALLWGYNKYNNVNAGFTNVLLSDLTFWQNINAWDSTLGQFDIDSIEFFSDIQTFVSLVQDAASVELSPGQAQQVGSVAQLLFDALQGAPAYQATNSTQAASVINILISANVVANTNYTAPEMVMGMANLTPMQLATLESQLENAIGIDGQNIPTNEQQYIDLLFKSLCTSSIQNYGSLGSSAVSTGGYAFFQAYFASQSLGASSPLGFAWDAGTSAATRSIADGAIPTATVWSADVLFNIFLEPQLPLLQDDNKIVKDLATEIFPELISISTNMTDLQGIPYFPAGPAFTKDTGIAASLIADHYQIQYLLDPVNWGPPVSEQQQLFGVLTIWSNAISSAQALANNSSGIPPPAVNGLGETHGKLGDEFTISGANLCNAVAVYFNNSPAWFQVNSSTNITTVAPAGTNTVDIRVVGPGGASQINVNDQFAYGAASPSPTNKVISLTGSLAFGNVTIGTNAQRTLTIGNTGNTNLTVNGIIYTNAIGFSGNWTGIIPAGSSTNVTVTFSPTVTTGYGGSITVNSDANGGINVISASGTGIAASSGSTAIIELIPWSDTDFGNVQVNSSAGRVVAIYNAGNEVLHVFSINYPTGFSGNLNSAYITPGNEAIDTITFTPTALMPYGGTMTVSTDATSGATNLTLSGTGISPSPPPTNQVPVGAFETLHSFDDYDGNNPNGLVLGSDGAFYGTTYRGGTKPNGNLNGWGTVFRIAPDGTFLSLYSFPYDFGAQNSFPNGASPQCSLVQGADGNFYGTTQFGGDPNWNSGTVFSITPSGVLANISLLNNTNGDVPWGLVQGNDGNFYGTSQAAGISPQWGSVFRVSPSGSFSNLFFFTGNNGWAPYAGLVLGTDGNFYGTTAMGGTNGGNGTVYEIAPDGTFTNLLSFNGTNGSSPYCSLVVGKDGALYGTAQMGGAFGSGTVFRITTNGCVTTLYSFTGGIDGSPYAGLVQASDGNFYGTTFIGGIGNNGTIFQLTPNGKFTTLHFFQGGSGGRRPMAAMVQGSDGNLYGTTWNGGITIGASTNHGTIFRFVIPPTVQPPAVAGNKITLAWNLVPGQIYQVQYTSDLASGNWVNLTDQLTPSVNVLTITDFLSATNQQRFYRIVEFPQAW